jgi:hypothetical protein
MKLFILKTILFIIPIITLSIIVYKLVPKKELDTQNYLGAIIDKHERLSTIKSPCIILAGGSNLAFGINSELIEKELKIPIVNLGLHGGLGLEFMLGELKSSIKERDTVYLSTEYWLSIKGDERLKRLASKLFPESKDYYPTNFTQNLSMEIDETRMLILGNESNEMPNAIQPSNDTIFMDIYSRKAFNSYGDEIAHLNQRSSFKSNQKKIHYSKWHGIELINEFYEFAKQKNVSVYFLFPCFPKSEYNLNKQAIDRLVNDIENELNVPVVNNSYDFIYEDSLFFDTQYHLNKSGRELRTQKLISIIKKHKRTTKNLINKELND